MKIDLRKEILNRSGERITAKVKVPQVKELDGGEIVEEQTFKAVVLTLGKALRDSVLTSSPMEVLTVEQKMDRYNLFLKIENDGVVDLTEDEIKSLKQYVCDRYEIIFFGQIVNSMNEVYE